LPHILASRRQENPMRTKIALSVDPGVVAEAKALGMNLSSVAEGALLAAIRERRNRQWQEEHGAALAAYAREVERDGLPLEPYRPF